MVSTSAVNRTVAAAARALGWEDFDGLPDQNAPALTSAAQLAWGLVEGHTRGRGIPVDLVPAGDPPYSAEEVAAVEAATTPPADLAAVALAATLRLAPNPAQRRSESTTTDAGSHRIEGGFEGFTLSEVVVLNRYRRRLK